MKKLAALLILIYTLTVVGAMSNATALAKAQKLFGPMAYLYTGKATTDSATTKEIRVVTTNCEKPLWVLGSGLGTWEAAFFSIPADTVKGPFSGAVTLKQQVAGGASVITAWNFIFDGVITSNKVMAPANFVQVQMVWNTREWADGVHVLCGMATDSYGRVGRTRPWLVLIDQTKASISDTITFYDNSSPINNLP